MSLSCCRTRIVCTIGPACESEAMIEQLVHAGMTVARINFSHGEFAWHSRVIDRIRSVSSRLDMPVAVMADLPGPKIRIGRIRNEPAVLAKGAGIVLSTKGVTGDARRVTVNFPDLPKALAAGDRAFLNDGLIELEVVETTADEVRCRVLAGGELYSRKGLNLPGADLGGAFTGRDRRCLEFALSRGVDAVSQSFVGGAGDVEAVRSAAADTGASPFVIAKIERAGALEAYDDILEAADGIMIARGDLGVEIPIEQIPVVQKDLIARAVMKERPVITATQMLESMTANRRPTRAEATDVANAVFDGTDAVMLSAETAAGRYPVEAAEMLVRIAGHAEAHAPVVAGTGSPPGGFGPVEIVAESVRKALERAVPAGVFVPTLSGTTARRIARLRPAVPVVAVTPSGATYRQLLFSRGVIPVHEGEYPEDWNTWIRDRIAALGLKGEIAILTEGPSPRHPDANHRMEIITL